MHSIEATLVIAISLCTTNYKSCQFSTKTIMTIQAKTGLVCNTTDFGHLVAYKSVRKGTMVYLIIILSCEFETPESFLTDFINH